MSVLKEGAPDLLEYLPGYPRMGAPHNISAIIRRLEKQVAELSAQSESAPIGPATAAHDRMVRDSVRYRWLRLHFKFANDSMRELWFDRDNHHSALKGQSADELDRAIDQEMSR